VSNKVSSGQVIFRNGVVAAVSEHVGGQRSQRQAISLASDLYRLLSAYATTTQAETRKISIEVELTEREIPGLGTARSIKFPVAHGAQIQINVLSVDSASSGESSVMLAMFRNTP